MLKALLWKEWRETRLIFFLMALIVPIFSLLLNNIDYVKEIKAETFALLYILTWVFFTILMAANQFASEEESGTLSFLLSRPIHWINIWLFKVLYGTISLILFGLFLFIMSTFFISPLLETVTLLETLLQQSPNYTAYINCNGALLSVSIMGVYFVSCIVSINIKSSFKAALMTLLVSGCLLFIMLCSSYALYFKASHHLFWIIFPILLIIIFIKYQPASYITRIAYGVLPFGGIIIWVLVSLQGGSLWVLLNNSLNYSGYNTDAPYIILLPIFPILSGICLSGISTSLFAFGILRRGYPNWWKSMSWNFFTVLAICFSAFLILITPQEKGIGLGLDGDYLRQDRNNSNLPLVIEDIYYLKLKTYQNNQPEYNRIIFPEQYLLLDRENGKARFYGRESFLQSSFQSISDDNRWAIYTSATLKWGIYYKWGLWAENLDTSQQYLLMTMDNKTIIKGEWFDGGKRFLIINRQDNRNYGRIIIEGHVKSSGKYSMLLFSVTDGEAKKIGEMQITNSSNLIHIDEKDRLYFYDSYERLVSCYNRDLIKEYNIDVIQEKFTEFKSEFEQIYPRSIYVREPMISPDGEHMIFSVRGYGKKQDTSWYSQVWCVSLPYGASKNLNDVGFDNYYYTWWGTAPWHPFADNLLLNTLMSESGHQEIRLIDLKNGAAKTLLEEKSDDNSRIFRLRWSGNGKYFLTYSYTANRGEMTVRLFEFDLETLSCRIISSKTNLKRYYIYSALWSPERYQVVFRSETDKEIWRLDLITGKWSKIMCPFNVYILLGISDRGEVFVAPEGKARIYRLTDKGTEIIFQGE